MAWLDPPECIAARQCLEQGNPAEAARVLLGCKYQRHRAVRALLVETGQRLVASAEELWRSGHVEAAARSIELAARCAALDGRGLVLQHEIRERLQRQDERRRRVAGQLEQARQLAGAGRLRSALDVLASAGDDPQATELREAVQRQLAQFDRHVGQCRRSLAAGDAEAARRHWQKARRLVPEDPQVAELAAAIARAWPRDAASAGQPLPISDRAQAFLLGDLALVVSAGEICLGTPRAEGVQVPIMGPLHSRHAVLLRDRRGWQLAVCRDRHGRACQVAVDGQQVESIGRLDHGKLIRLGSGNCTWRFLMPVPGSATAVLEAVPGSEGQVWTGSGRPIRRVVLMDEQLVLRAARPAHVVMPELPCKQLVFRWEAGALRYDVEGGTAALEVPGRTIAAEDNRLCLPSRLVIEPQLEEAELLGRVAAGCEPAQRVALELAAPSGSTAWPR